MRTVYLSLDECYGYIERALTPYVGAVVAEVADHRPFLECILETYCYGHSLSGYDPYTQLVQFKVPTEIAHRVIGHMSRDILKMIIDGFQITYPSRNYEFTMRGRDVVVNEHEVIHRLQPLRAFKEDVLIDDDGYTPERLRQRS